MKLTTIVEKPDCEGARNFLSVSSRERPENYFAAFEAYVITKDVYEQLAYIISYKIVNSKKEVELTDALEYIRNNKGMMAFVPDGKSYNIGNATAYRNTVSEFAKENADE